MIRNCTKCSLVVLMLFAIKGLSAQDLKLWYQQPATKWTEALPVGNGRIGAMIFGGVAEDRIQFNEETLWTDGPRNYNRQGAYKYLDTIRQLLFEGKQKEAEDLAGREFMGLQSKAGDQQKWVKEMISLNGMKGNPALVNFDDSHWKTMQVPSFEGWEATGLEDVDGAVWFRTTVDLPSSWTGKKMVLDLNRIRDYDLTYVNGKLAGSQPDATPRKYIVPAGMFHTGKNIIAIQVLNFHDKGGIAGYKDTTKHIGIYPEGAEQSKISLNGEWKYFIQNDDPPAVSSYQASYQPFGDLMLYFKHNEVTNYRRELDISNAVAATTYTADGVNFKRSYFVSEPNQAAVVHLTSNRQGKINFEAVLSSPHKYFTVRKIDNQTIALSLKVNHGALRGESYLQVKISGGTVRVVNGRINVTNANEATLYLTAGTNYKNYQDVSADPATPCLKALASVSGKTYGQVEQAHIKEYQQYFNTLSIKLNDQPDGTNLIPEAASLPTDERIKKFAGTNDPSFVALYLQYGRYLLISASRPGTRPANLQGIWNDQLTPPWGSKYTTNINLEMNYWPAESLNLSPMATPLFQMIKELAVTGHETAKDYYNAPGWVLHHNTDLWRGTAPINASNHGIWVSGGAWLTQHLWEHFAFTQDTGFLKKQAYPLMKQSAMFFNHYLVKDPVSGYLVSTPSNSPEQGGLVAGPTMDHEIIRNLFKNVIAASEILGIDKTFRETLETKYKQIAPYKIGRYGQLQEWMQDIDDTSNKHRHVSHLWAQYPGNEINWDETPGLMKAARQSLIYRGDAATGWSLGWKINLWARFKDGDHVYNLLKMLISPASEHGAGSYPNLFDAHPPFQIDGNFGGAAGIGEMLLQSQTSFIDILPALPSALPYGEVEGLCARGGFVVNIKWQQGKLEKLTLVSKAGDSCQLRYNGKVVSLKTIKGKTYLFDGELTKL